MLKENTGNKGRNYYLLLNLTRHTYFPIAKVS